MRRGEYSFDAYGKVLTDPRFKETFSYSVVMALFTIVFGVLLVVPTAYWVRLKLPHLRPSIEFITLLPLVIPAIVIVFGYIRLYNTSSWLPLTGTTFGGPGEAHLGRRVAEHTLVLARGRAAVLRRLFDKAKFAISTEETRYYLNGVYMHVADTEGGKALRCVATDGHRLARGHPGAAVIPTVLAILPATNAQAADLFSAISVGYDVGVRIAAAQMPATIPTRQTGRWASIAAAGAAARLLTPRKEHIAHALASATVLAPNQQANGSSGYSRLTGNDVKEGIAWSAVLGLTAVNLALAGHTGPADVFDHPEYYDRATILNGLGSQSYIAGTYFKPYACCRYIHAALDAFFDLIGEGRIAAEDITGVEIETFSWALRLGNRLEPATIVDVQYSLPYCIAIAAIEGRNALTPLASGLLDRPDLTSFAGKVKLCVSGDIDALFPGETLARVSVSTASGRHRSDVRGPLGDPQRPLHRARWLGQDRLVGQHAFRRRPVADMDQRLQQDERQISPC